MERHKNMDEKNIQTPEKGTEQEELTPEEKVLKEKNPEETPEKTPGSEVIEPEPEKKPSEPIVDYKVKFGKSTAENQILTEAIKKLESRLGLITTDETPTDTEMREKYPYWDEMMDLEKKLAINQVVLEHRLNKVSLSILEMADEKRWNEEFDRFLEKAEILNQFPELKGKEKDFREYAKKPTHKGMDLEVIAKAFLYNPAKEPVKEKVPNKPVLEKGSGGGGQPPKAEMSPEDIKLLREQDPKLYNLYVKQGKIKLS